MVGWGWINIWIWVLWEILHSKAGQDSFKCKQIQWQIYDISPSDLENNIPQSVWESTSQLISQEDAVTKKDGFSTLQKLTEEQVNDTDLALDYNNMQSSWSTCEKYTPKLANPKEMTFTEYCAFMQSLDSEQHHIVMYNRSWCREYVHASWQNKILEG